MVSLISRRTALGGTAGLLLGAPFFEGSAWAASQLSRVDITSARGNGALTVQEVVKSQGFFKQFELDPHIEELSDGTKLVSALISGGSDIGVLVGFSQALAAIERGAPIKIISAATVLGQDAMFSAKPGVHSVGDLKGKTIGVGALGAQLHQESVALLNKQGLSSTDVRFVSIGSSTDVFRAVVAGVVDAGIAEADVFGSLQKYGVHVLKNSIFVQNLREYTPQASIATQSIIDKKRDVLVRVLAAYGKAFRFVQTDPNSQEAFIQARWKVLGGRDFKTAAAQAVEQWKFIRDNKTYELDLLISRERVDYMQRLNIEVGAQHRILPYEEVADMSLAADAVRLIA